MRDANRPNAESRDTQPASPPSSYNAPRSTDRVMPWLISALLHVAIVLLALFIVWVLPQQQPDPLTVPTLGQSEPRQALLDVEPLPGPPNADDSIGKPDIDVDEFTPVDPPDFGPNDPSEITKVTPDGAGQGETRDDKGGWFTLGPASRSPHTGDPPPAMPRPDSVVYIVDASGSMVEQLASVRHELVRSIRRLQPDQSFNAVFFRDGEALPLWPRGLRAASDANRRFAMTWVTSDRKRVAPGGSSDPLAALEAALRWRPDEIWLLSDNITGAGRFALEPEALVERIAEFRARYRAENTRVHAIQFLRDDPHRTLERIAAANRGLFRKVESTDLY